MTTPNQRTIAKKNSENSEKSVKISKNREIHDFSVAFLIRNRLMKFLWFQVHLLHHPFPGRQLQIFGWALQPINLFIPWYKCQSLDMWNKLKRDGSQAKDVLKWHPHRCQPWNTLFLSDPHWPCLTTNALETTLAWSTSWLFATGHGAMCSSK